MNPVHMNKKKSYFYKQRTSVLQEIKPPLWFSHFPDSTLSVGFTGENKLSKKNCMVAWAINLFSSIVQAEEKLRADQKSF